MNGDMMTLLKVLEERVQWIRDDIKETNGHLKNITGTLNTHHTTLYGKNSDKGLCGKVDENRKTIVKLLIATAVIAAGIGGGTAEVLHLVGV